jgi:hypothetical protein
MTRLPASASAAARLHAVVDVPSPTCAPVTTNTRCPRPWSRNCRLVRSLRKASARADPNASSTISGRVGTCRSWAISASTGAAVSSSNGTSGDTGSIGAVAGRRS